MREGDVDWYTEGGDGMHLSVIIEEGSPTEQSSPHTATAHITHTELEPSAPQEMVPEVSSQQCNDRGKYPIESKDHVDIKVGGVSQPCTNQTAGRQQLYYIQVYIRYPSPLQASILLCP